MCVSENFCELFAELNTAYVILSQPWMNSLSCRWTTQLVAGKSQLCVHVARHRGAQVAWWMNDDQVYNLLYFENGFLVKKKGNPNNSSISYEKYPDTSNRIPAKISETD